MYVPPLGQWQSRRTLATAPRSAGRPALVCGGAPWLPRTRRRGREGRQNRAAFAGRELAFGGLDGEGDGGAGEQEEAEPLDTSRGAPAAARARPGCDICYDMFCIL